MLEDNGKSASEVTDSAVDKNEMQGYDASENNGNASAAVDKTMMTRWKTEAGTIDSASNKPRNFKTTDMVGRVRP